MAASEDLIFCARSGMAVWKKMDLRRALIQVFESWTAKSLIQRLMALSIGDQIDSFLIGRLQAQHLYQINPPHSVFMVDFRPVRPLLEYVRYVLTP